MQILGRMGPNLKFSRTKPFNELVYPIFYFLTIKGFIKLFKDKSRNLLLGRCMGFQVQFASFLGFLDQVISFSVYLKANKNPDLLNTL